MPFYESPAQSPALSEVAEDDLYDLDLQRLNQELQGEDELDADGESTGAQAHMNEVLPNLWIGDITAAMDKEALEQHNISRVVSVLRGSIPLSDKVVGHSIPVDDDAAADLLAHLPFAVMSIREGMEASEQGMGGVLVHCQAGMSRSATIVAAYLMSEHGLLLEEALHKIRSARRCIQPSDTFMNQLEIFQAANYRVSDKDKVTRDFYRDRIVTEVLNGDGSALTSTHFARFPATPGVSRPPTPGGSTTIIRKRKLRCGSCRQELALREHVIHASSGTPGATTPSGGSHGPVMSPLALTPALRSAAPSPPPESSSKVSEKGSSSTVPTPTSSSTAPSGPCVPDGPPSLPPPSRSLPPAIAKARTKSMLAALGGRHNLASLTTAAMSLEDESEDGTGPPSPGSVVGSDFDGDVPITDSHSDSPLHRKLSLSRMTFQPMTSLPTSTSAPAAVSSSTPGSSRRPSFAGLQPMEPINGASHSSASARSSEQASRRTSVSSVASGAPGSGFQSRRRSSGALSAMDSSNTPPASQIYTPPPILSTAKCSGYFLEPMSWMDSIKSGSLGGKLLCPNTKCKAKIGNFDWAGQKCGCGQWITPGLCLHKSKVDDIVF